MSEKIISKIIIIIIIIIKLKILKIILSKSIFSNICIYICSSKSVEKRSIKIVGQLVLDIFNSDPLLSHLRCYEKGRRKRKKCSFL